MDLQERKEIARYLISNEEFVATSLQREDREVEGLVRAPRCATLFAFEYPDGLKPAPLPIDPKPAPSAPLPRADVVIVTWTVAECEALADVFTCPYHRPSRSAPTRNDWYLYNRNFLAHYRDLIRKGAPSRGDCDDVNILGSYFLSKVGEKRVLCFKSELHLNQDGKKTGNGTATLPVKDLFKQIIEETGAEYIITTGTCGATYTDHDLGDVVVTRSAKFRLRDEFRNEVFNGAVYRSDWNPATTYFELAESFMRVHTARVQEPEVHPPTAKYQNADRPLSTAANRPNIYLEGRDLGAEAPILTTDYFEFGNSTNNNLAGEGCGVEMGDAVLGLVCSEMGERAPKWLVVRNLSDPVINGHLREDPRGVMPRLHLQTMWAVWYYETYGYWTSVNSALTTWAIIAGI